MATETKRMVALEWQCIVFLPGGDRTWQKITPRNILQLSSQNNIRPLRMITACDYKGIQEPLSGFSETASTE
jgi:hypothetical protein